jgi:hypothetical protein
VFLARPDGSIFKLDVGLGTLAKVAESRDDFWTKAGEESIANDWLMIPLADELAESGISLKPGQCYGFKTPPVLGGQYAVKNCGALSFVDYIGGCGSIHSQLSELPDGTQVVLRSE